MNKDWGSYRGGCYSIITAKGRKRFIRISQEVCEVKVLQVLRFQEVFERQAYTEQRISRGDIVVFRSMSEQV